MWNTDAVRFSVRTPPHSAMHIIRPRTSSSKHRAPALTVVGGRSVGRIPATEFGDFFKDQVGLDLR